MTTEEIDKDFRLKGGRSHGNGIMIFILTKRIDNKGDRYVTWNHGENNFIPPFIANGSLKKIIKERLS
jgi:hypothetical protein